MWDRRGPMAKEEGVILFKVLMLLICFGALTGGVATIIYDIFLAFELDRILRRGEREHRPSVDDALPEPARVILKAPIAPIESRVRSVANPRRAIGWNAPVKLARIAASGKK
jgi:hypothetical protein